MNFKSSFVGVYHNSSRYSFVFLRYLLLSSNEWIDGKFFLHSGWWSYILLSGAALYGLFDTLHRIWCKQSALFFPVSQLIAQPPKLNSSLVFFVNSNFIYWSPNLISTSVRTNYVSFNFYHHDSTWRAWITIFYKWHTSYNHFLIIFSHTHSLASLLATLFLFSATFLTWQEKKWSLNLLNFFQSSHSILLALFFSTANEDTMCLLLQHSSTTSALNSIAFSIHSINHLRYNHISFFVWNSHE